MNIVPVKCYYFSLRDHKNSSEEFKFCIDLLSYPFKNKKKNVKESFILVVL